MTRRSLAPAQVVPSGLLGALRLPAAPAGVVLGRDANGSALLVPVFGPAPASIVYVGGWWAVQVLVNRCLAHGASVIVDAVDGGATPGTLAGLPQWLGLARVTGGAQVSPSLRRTSAGPRALRTHVVDHQRRARPTRCPPAPGRRI